MLSLLIIDNESCRRRGEDERGADCSHRSCGHSHLLLDPHRLCHPESETGNLPLNSNTNSLKHVYGHAHMHTFAQMHMHTFAQMHMPTHTHANIEENTHTHIRVHGTAAPRCMRHFDRLELTGKGLASRLSFVCSRKEALLVLQ